MSSVWVIGGNGLIGEALKRKAQGSQIPFQFPTRNEFEIGVKEDLPIKANDIVIDMIPTPRPRQLPNLSDDLYREKYIEPHLHFTKKAFEKKISKYIFISSGGAIYGPKSVHKKLIETDELNPISGYGKAKKIQEEFIIHHAEKSKVPFIILRPSNVFNSDPKSPRQSGLVGILKTKFENKQAIDLFGPTTISKDYISNFDVANAIFESVFTNKSGIFNIGSGKVHSIQEILNAFEKSFNFQIEKNHKPIVHNDVEWFCLDNSKAIKDLDFKVSIDVIDWIVLNTNQPF